MEDPELGVRRMVKQWAGKRPDIDARPLALFGRLTRADALAGTVIASALRTHGLNRGEFDVLATLHRGEDPEGLSPGTLASSMSLSPAATTNRIDRLEAAGLLTRGPDPADGRGVRVRLTAKGREIADEAVSDHVRGMERMLSGLSAAERDQLSGLLARLLHSITRVG
ncbi:MarR family transcriptional regulator [Streptosporangium sp. NPDC051022]|uniref:MarR family winged helix-turn-helix transcriptional regulator n=1 Tax=Streptosporangium sp. NPDC051022 TaxID=3155752 RepID=UPI00343753B9